MKQIQLENRPAHRSHQLLKATVALHEHHE